LEVSDVMRLWCLLRKVLLWSEHREAKAFEVAAPVRRQPPMKLISILWRPAVCSERRSE
jgi:hypothetical protein